MASGRTRWLAAFVTSAVGVGMLAWSLSMDPEAAGGALLFVGGLCAVVASGGFYKWRGGVASAVMPGLLVLLFPEGGPKPADPGACDPFCADPVAGLDAALVLAACGLVLALLGWLLAIIVSAVRRRRGPDSGRGSPSRSRWSRPL
jgi:hypothetical protein